MIFNLDGKSGKYLTELDRNKNVNGYWTDSTNYETFCSEHQICIHQIKPTSKRWYVGCYFINNMEFSRKSLQDILSNLKNPICKGKNEKEILDSMRKEIKKLVKCIYAPAPVPNNIIILERITQSSLDFLCGKRKTIDYQDYEAILKDPINL